MKKKNSFLIWILALMFCLPMMAKAVTNPVINNAEGKGGDLVFVTATKGTYDIAGYLVGKNISGAIYFANPKSTAYISMPNGNYYIWAKDTQGNYSNGLLYNMTSSCQISVALNQTGSGSAANCILKGKDGTTSSLYTGTLYSCASGYSFDVAQTGPYTNNCDRLTFNDYGALDKRFCQKTYTYACIKNAVSINSKLDSLSLSNGFLTPEFSSDTYSYATTINDSSVTINATLKDSNASFADGYGPRTVNLNYGNNSVIVKVNANDGSGSSTYTINIRREDNRDTTNTLRALTISQGNLTPTFNANTVYYKVSVADGVSSIKVDATLMSDKATFLDGYGSRTVNLNAGLNNIFIKVKSESNAVKTYTLAVTRGTNSGDSGTGTENPDTPTDVSKALLKSLVINNGELPLDFVSTDYNYNINVNNNVSNISVTAVPEFDTDTVVVTGADQELKVNEINEITVVVTSKENVTNTYTIYVNRKEENVEVSTDSSLKSLTIKGYSIKFSKNTFTYSLNLKSGTTYLDIVATPNDSKSEVTIEGNEKLTTGSEIKIRVKAEDGTYSDYLIKITGFKKQSNVILIIIIIILVIIALAYLIMRLLGYRLYFDFKGLFERIKYLFTKKE